MELDNRITYVHFLLVLFCDSKRTRACSKHRSLGWRREVGQSRRRVKSDRRDTGRKEHDPAQSVLRWGKAKPD